MGRNVEQNEAAREAAQERLVDAALALFAERGFAGTSTARIAQRAGVSKGLLFHYFPDKTALVAAVVQRHVARVAAVAAAVPADLEPPERLAAFAHAVAEQVDAEPEGFAVLIRALTDPQLRRIAGGFAVDRAEMVGLFEALGAADPDLEARFFQVAMLGILAHRVLSPVEVAVGPLVSRLLAAVLEER
ncbi:MAG: TetR/AcrR family transcriptional regulator [Myxococcales bacterium]|nr:TetR/AcrR family transcriptional regulator [Myxococcales bacterium]